MKHQVKGYKIGRTASHRKATLQAMSNALIKHKRIETTLVKAKALRIFVEPILNRAKEDTMHNRRVAFSYLQDKEGVKELFGDIAEKIADRPGGYTRIVRIGARKGDASEIAVIELVDYNDVRPDGSGGKSGKAKTRRSRRRGGSKGEGVGTSAVVKDVKEVAPKAPVVEETVAVVEETPVVEEAVAVVEDTPVVEEAVAVVEDTVVEETPEVVSSGDDLSIIKGVGPVMLSRLQDRGIFTFDQLAEWGDADVEAMERMMEYTRIAEERWVFQAGILAKMKRQGATLPKEFDFDADYAQG